MKNSQYKKYFKVELDLDDVEVTNVMIDVDGTNLEEGIDVYYEDDYAFCVIGMDARNLDDKDKEILNNELYNFLYN